MVISLRYTTLFFTVSRLGMGAVFLFQEKVPILYPSMKESESILLPGLHHFILVGLAPGYHGILFHQVHKPFVVYNGKCSLDTPGFQICFQRI
jgi:hypothetical protein